MKLSQISGLTTLLRRLAQEPEPALPAGLEQRSLTVERGGSLPLLQPAGGGRALVLALHGLTVNGGGDRRLVHFARCLARAGISCAVPTLPALADGRFDPADLTALEACAEAASAATGLRPGLVGFSLGGSYALVAACGEALRNELRFVISFGAYHSLADLFRGFVAAAHSDPTTAAAWDDWIYLQLVLAHQHGESAGLSPALAQQVLSLLRRYCHEASAQEKREFFERELRPRHLVPLAAGRQQPDVLEALSPAGKLMRLRCPVSLVHDRGDSLVPPSHARALQAELATVGHGAHRVLVTSLLSHVSLGSLLRLDQVARLYAALGPILAEA